MMTPDSKDIFNYSKKNSESLSPKSYQIGSRKFDFRKSYVMGILNVTPDSFSDGGKYYTKQSAVDYGLQMIDEGADIIDIGGESTRPGAESVESDEEIDRVIPVIEGILSQSPNAIVSIDTTKADVADAALGSGAKIVNDVSGLSFDLRMTEVIAKFDASVIIMHMKGTPQTMQLNPCYDDVVSDVHNFLFTRLQKAESMGIKKIFIDPGIGFGKRVEDNFRLINHLDFFTDLGYPIVIGVSRKSFIGKTLNLETWERDEASSQLDAVAILKGARIIRTHNIKTGVKTCNLFNEMMAASV